MRLKFWQYVLWRFVKGCVVWITCPVWIPCVLALGLAGYLLEATIGWWTNLRRDWRTAMKEKDK